MKKETAAALYLAALCAYLFLPLALPKNWVLVLFSFVITTAGMWLEQRKQRWLSFERLALLGLSAISLVKTQVESYSLYQGLYLLFFAIAAYSLFRLIRKILIEPRPGRYFLILALNGYLLAGYMFAVFCSYLEFLSPGSFSSTSPLAFNDLHAFVYYAFVTYLSIGFGDMLPVSGLAQSMAILMGISGTFYLTLVVGLVMGKYFKESGSG